MSKIITQPAFKIQVRMELEYLPGQKQFPWADMEKTPDFATYDQASQWMVDNGCEKLYELALRFRIVPLKLPCEFMAQVDWDLARYYEKKKKRIT